MADKWKQVSELLGEIMDEQLATADESVSEANKYDLNQIEDAKERENVKMKISSMNNIHKRVLSSIANKDSKQLNELLKEAQNNLKV